MAQKRKTDPIPSISEQLLKAKAELEGKLSLLSQEERNTKEELRRVDAMLRASGDGKTQSTALPAPKKTDVVAATSAILDAGPMPLKELRDAVAKRLREAHTLAGFALRFKEAMQSPQFVIEDDRVRLSSRHPKEERKLQ